MPAERRLAFGQIAELYDRTRPSYPSALIDDVLAYAGAAPGDAALEVGAGTGKATVLFAQRGLEIVALEPSPEMAQVARRNTEGAPNVTVLEAEFEGWPADRRFRLLYSGQAWHWIDPQLRYTRAAEALAEGGALAVFWNGVLWEDAPLREDLDTVYGRLAPELSRPASPMRPSSEAPREWLEWETELTQAGGFVEPDRREYEWVYRYSAQEYVSLLQTHSDHIVLEPTRRAALLSAVAQVIDEAGGVIETDYVSRLALARRAGGEGAGRG